MTALAFLRTDTGPAAPLAESPMTRQAAAAGAHFESRDGWKVAVSYAGAANEARACRDGVGWADASHLGKLELHASRAHPETLPALVDRVAHVGLDAGRGERAEGAWWCRLTPTRALAISHSGAAATLRHRVGQAGPGSIHVLDVTGSYGALVIAGPLARETIARFCALDLRPQSAPPGAFRPGSVARIPGFVLCEGHDRYRLLFGAAYATYVWEVVSDAAVHLGGCPVGIDAIAITAAERGLYA